MVNLIPNIILSGEKLKAFSLRSGTRQGHPLTSLLFKIALEFLAMTIREEKDVKGIQIVKEEIHLSLFKDATRKLLELIKEFSKVAGDNINTQKSVVFLYTKNKRSKEDVSLHQINNPIYHHIKINKIPRDSPT